MTNEHTITLNMDSPEGLETQLNDMRQVADEIITQTITHHYNNLNPNDRFKTPLIHAEYAPAPDIERIAKQLIRSHDVFAELREGAFADVRIRYMWRKKGGQSQGKPVLGKCQKLSGLTHVLADGADYLIWVAADHVQELRLTNYQVEALIFHELCHISVIEDDEGEIGMSIKAHDAEVFSAELEHYGLWSLQLQNIAEAFAQTRLPGV